MTAKTPAPNTSPQEAPKTPGTLRCPKGHEALTFKRAAEYIEYGTLLKDNRIRPGDASDMELMEVSWGWTAWCSECQNAYEPIFEDDDDSRPIIGWEGEAK